MAGPPVDTSPGSPGFPSFGISLAAASPVAAPAEPIFTEDFPAAEFAERRGQVSDAIGATGAAVLQGAASPLGCVRLRQTNSFRYLTGVETPYAALLLNGRRGSRPLPAAPEPAARGFRGPAPLRRGEPQFRVPEERIHLRLEEVIWNTEDGAENLSEFVPMTLDGIEETMRGEGIRDRYPSPESRRRQGAEGCSNEERPDGE